METATGRAEHWDQAYRHGDTTRSWYQHEARWSLRMMDRAGIGPSDSVIDVGGGSSPLASALLARGHSDITVFDVSFVGMGIAQQRLGADAKRVQWLLGDLLTWRPTRHYTGYSSSLAAATLRELGLRRATDLVGGFQALLTNQQEMIGLQPPNSS